MSPGLCVLWTLGAGLCRPGLPRRLGVGALLRAAGGWCPAWVLGEGSMWGLRFQPKVQSACAPLRPGPNRFFQLGCRDKPGLDVPEGPGEFGILGC